MGMVVRTNTMAQNAFRQLNVNNNAVSKSLEKLSSGFKINRAGDDAAGLAISEKMKAQIKGLETASANAQDGISLIQTAEGALNEVHSMLNRMVELATKSANGTYSTTEREALQNEVDSLLEEIDRISESTNFNGINLLDGSMGFNADAFSVNDVAAVAGKSAEIADTKFAKSYTEYTWDDTNGVWNPGTPTSTKPGTVASNYPDAPNDGDKVWLEAGENADLHFTKNGEQVNPSFKLDLADIKVTVSADGTGAGNTVNFTLTGSNGTAVDVQAELTKAGDYDGKQLAAAIADKYKNGIAYQGATYSVAVDGSKLSFTYKNTGAVGATGTVIDDNVLSPTGKFAAKAAADQGTNVKISAGAQDHNTFDVKNPVAPTDGGRAGITFDMSTGVVGDGNRLTIDGTTFVFKTSKESAAAAGKGEILVDVSDKAAADQVKEAIDIMSRHETANFKVESSIEDGSIHIDQKVNNENVYADRKALTGLFSLSTGAQAAGTAITLTQDNLKSGNSLNIGGKAYTFGENVSVGATANDTMNNLKAALYADGYTSQVSGSTLTVYSNSAESKVGPSAIGGGLTLQIGDTGEKFNQMTVAVADMSAKGIGVNGLDITTADNARNAIDTIKNAINAVSTNRAAMGAMQNRLDYTINNLDTAVENMSSANSRIRDTDMAKEMMNYTQMNILTQAAQAMLAQANQQPQSILQLL